MSDFHFFSFFRFRFHLSSSSLSRNKNCHIFHFFLFLFVEREIIARMMLQDSDDRVVGAKEEEKEIVPPKLENETSSNNKTLGEAFRKLKEEEDEKKMRRHSSEFGVIGRTRRRRRRWSSSEEEDDEIDQDDPYRLKRFVSCQKSDFPRALREIKNGRKCSCWMWYVIPTAPWVVNGREKGSYTNRQYALRDPDNRKSGDKATKAYLELPETDGVCLRQNYLNITLAIADQLENGNDSKSLMGFLDAPKLESSVKLFERIAGDIGDLEVKAACSRVVKCFEKEKSIKKSRGGRRNRVGRYRFRRGRRGRSESSSEDYGI